MTVTIIICKYRVTKFYIPVDDLVVILRERLGPGDGPGDGLGDGGMASLDIGFMGVIFRGLGMESPTSSDFLFFGVEGVIIVAGGRLYSKGRGGATARMLSNLHW